MVLHFRLAALSLPLVYIYDDVLRSVCIVIASDTLAKERHVFVTVCWRKYIEESGSFSDVREDKVAGEHGQP